MNLQKTKIQNKLQFDTLRATLLATSFIADNGGINNFDPSDEMILKAHIISKENKSKILEKARKENQCRDSGDGAKNRFREEQSGEKVVKSCFEVHGKMVNVAGMQHDHIYSKKIAKLNNPMPGQSNVNGQKKTCAQESEDWGEQENAKGSRSRVVRGRMVIKVNGITTRIMNLIRTSTS